MPDASRDAPETIAAEARLRRRCRRTAQKAPREPAMQCGSGGDAPAALEAGMVAPDVATFNQLREQAVAEQDPDKPGEVWRRKRAHTDVRAERRERQVDADRHDAGGKQDDRCRGPALEEGDMLRPDHV